MFSLSDDIAPGIVHPCNSKIYVRTVNTYLIISECKFVSFFCLSRDLVCPLLLRNVVSARRGEAAGHIALCTIFPALLHVV